MKNKTLAIFVVLMLAVSVAIGAVTGVFSSIKIGANTVIPAGTLGYTGTGYNVLSDSPALTGVPIAPTAAPGTSTTQLATTAFVQAAASANSRVCNANGCYFLYPDGTIEAWGSSAVTGSTGSAFTLAITFPHALTTTADSALTVSAISDASGDGNPHPADCHVLKSSISTSGASATIVISVQVGGSGYAALGASDYCAWHLYGH